ncbi:MAG: nicotinate phosphoribosyltransferase [Nanoarchaeota archaeon]|nr:nicotinate phosphoribosyltransferase [Nanoarchaeota archaeon]
MKTTNFSLPEKPQPYADKYFLRTGEVLRAEGINPWVRAQVMIRKGPGQVYGVDEALAVLEKYSPLKQNGGRVYALEEGADYAPRETLMLIEAPIQDIVELETMYLGVLSAETTKANDRQGVDLNQVRENMAAVVKAARGRPVSYFGARHWRFDEDAAITWAAYEGGATSASTDAGAGTFRQKGMGTTPHVLENIMAWKYGRERAVLETLLAFDRHIDAKVPRIILCDYRNEEITDTLACAKGIGNRLWGPRIDTCGENVGEGALEFPDAEKLAQLVGRRIIVPTEDEKYWFGHGVNVTGVYAMRKALNEKGYANMKLALSSGFAEPRKVEAFANAEEILGVKLFDLLGVGQVFKSRAAKMDIVAVGETPESFVPISKTGRGYNPNLRLKLRLGGGR